MKKENNILQISESSDIVNGKLSVRGEEYKEIEVIFANNCFLEEIELECSSLKWLYLNGNLLEKIDLSKVPNLEILVISNNRLTKLKVKHLKKLKTLWCFNNYLKKLDCSGLENLEDLNCSGPIRDFGKMETFSCLEWIVLKDCHNLLAVDCDGNDIEDLTPFESLPNLKSISLAINNFYRYLTPEWKFMDNGIEIDPQLLSNEKREETNRLILNSPNLIYINVKYSDIKEVIFGENKPDFSQLKTIYSNTYEGAIADKNFNEYSDWSDYEWKGENRDERRKISEQIEHRYYSNNKKNNLIIFVIISILLLVFISVFLPVTVFFSLKKQKKQK